MFIAPIYKLHASLVDNTQSFKKNIIMHDNNLENEKSMRRFLIYKYITEIVIFLIIFIGIFIFRYFNFFDNATTGTLIGTAVGYLLSDIRKLHT